MIFDNGLTSGNVFGKYFVYMESAFLGQSYKFIVMKRFSQAKSLRFPVALVFILFLSCGKNSSYNSNSSAQLINYSGSFMKSAPQDSTSGMGTVSATFNLSTLQLKYTISWNSLSSTPIAMHFHDKGPVIVPINGFPANLSGTISGVATLTSTQATDLSEGSIYAMIHTQNYVDGEIMATLVKQ